MFWSNLIVLGFLFISCMNVIISAFVLFRIMMMLPIYLRYSRDISLIYGWMCFFIIFHKDVCIGWSTYYTHGTVHCLYDSSLSLILGNQGYLLYVFFVVDKISFFLGHFFSGPQRFLYLLIFIYCIFLLYH